MDTRFRRFLKYAVADLIHYSGALRLKRLVRQRFFRKEVGCVLGFHRVLNEVDSRRTNCVEGMVLTEENFVQLLEYLKERFRIVPLCGVLDEMRAPSGSKPFCALTFDDGWSDTYQAAFPWLKKYAMPAAVFLTTDAVDRKGGFWIERLKKAWGEQDLRKQAGSILATVGPRQIRTADFQEILEWLMHMPWRQRHSLLDQILPRRSEESDGVDFMLTWDQAIEMERAGIEIGAHTASHPLLTYEDDATVEYELLSSKRTLEGKLNKPVRAFTYPNGDWNARVRGWVVRTGYAIAFTTRPKWCRSGQDPYAIGRIIIHDGNVTDAKGIFSTSMVDRTLSA